MPSGVDVGIDAQGHRRAPVEVGGDGVDHLQFGLALDVEGKNALAQGVLDLGPGFAHAGERAAFRLAAGLQHAEQLARRDDVEARALAGDQVEDGEVAVGLDRVADEVVQPAQRRVEPAQMVANRRRTVDVQGRAVRGGEAGEIDPLATKLTLVVVEGMHGENARQEERAASAGTNS